MKWGDTGTGKPRGGQLEGKAKERRRDEGRGGELDWGLTERLNGPFINRYILVLKGENRKIKRIKKDCRHQSPDRVVTLLQTRNITNGVYIC